jgi:hypothetical protein
MSRGLAVLFGVLILVAAVPALPQRTETAVPLAVIVHPTRSVQLSPQDVRRVYLKKRRFWDDGAPVIAINQEPGTVARESFSQHLFGNNSGQLGAYWNQQYFQGILPPITLSSGAAVKRYVAHSRDAIGYVELNQVDDSICVALRLE